VLVDGEERSVFTYIARQESLFIQPAESYLEICKAGRVEHSLDIEQLNAAAHAATKGQESPGLLNRVFVYGTLMQGECRHRCVAEQGGIRYENAARVAGSLYDCGNYPMLQLRSEPCNTVIGQIRSEISRDVCGEMYEFPDVNAALEVLDGVEGFQNFGNPGSLFRRTLCMCTVENEQPIRAWVYVGGMSDYKHPYILSGNWRSR